MSTRNFHYAHFRKIDLYDTVEFYSTCFYLLLSLLEASVLIILQCTILSIIPVVNIFLLNFTRHSVL